MPTDPIADRLRRIPAVDRLLASEPFEALLSAQSRPRVLAELRAELEALRGRARHEEIEATELTGEALAARVGGRIERGARSYYRRVINATGVVLHTGLGRSSLPAEAVAAVTALATTPQRLEIDLETAERGGRDAGCAGLLTEILDCEAATVVNNNAAATLVALAATAEGRGVVLSRGELVEIGGSYRIPEIIRQSGARLVEVGTTNRTHRRDYENAIDDETGALLKVHTSNYQVLGFTSEVDIGDLAEIGRAASVPVIHDLGSGCLIELEGFGLPPDQLVQRSLAAGADLVCFSGDKLLGGPQAGILAGSAFAVERCRAHPLFRAVRPGRLIYTALESTLQLYLDGAESATTRIPTLARLTEPPEQLERRARALASGLRGVPGLTIVAQECVARAGSGALPLAEIASWGLRVAFDGLSAAELAFDLRDGEPAVLPRVSEGAVWLDLRAVAPDEDSLIEARLRQVATELRSADQKQHREG